MPNKNVIFFFVKCLTSSLNKEYSFNQDRNSEHCQQNQYKLGAHTSQKDIYEWSFLTIPEYVNKRNLVNINMI